MATNAIVTVVLQVTWTGDQLFGVHEAKRCLERELLAGVERAREHYPGLGMPAIEVEAMPAGATS